MNSLNFSLFFTQSYCNSAYFMSFFYVILFGACLCESLITFTIWKRAALTFCELFLQYNTLCRTLAASGILCISTCAALANGPAMHTAYRTAKSQEPSQGLSQMQQSEYQYLHWRLNSRGVFQRRFEEKKNECVWQPLR